MRRLDDWYSKFYDPENKEFEKIIECIEDKFGQKTDLNILEVGCGTGRISHKLIQKYSKVVAIDNSEKYISYCKSKYKKDKIEFEYSDIKDFNSKEFFDVIIFGWIGFHYQEEIDTIIKNLKKIANKGSLIVILDAYFDTEYVNVLQMIREVDINHTKIRKEKLNELLVKEFGNLNQEVLLTHYKFDNIKSVIDNFKIELTLEESHIWTKDDEEKLKKYLVDKENPLVIDEGLWISVINVESK
jgi:ubiquinone/menaquinone biosynthesis C-methylase UbiE